MYVPQIMCAPDNFLNKIHLFYACRNRSKQEATGRQLEEVPSPPAFQLPSSSPYWQNLTRTHVAKQKQNLQPHEDKVFQRTTETVT